MGDLLQRLLSAEFMPHGHCYFWEPGLVWLEVLTNAAIGFAYFSISFTLAYVVRRIRDIPFQWVYVAFGVFIITCGFTHLMDVWVIWTPRYWLDGSIRAITAVASVGTAVMLFPLVPKAIALAGAARMAHERGVQIEKLNVELAALYEKTRETLAEAIPQLVWTASPDGSADHFNHRWSEYAGDRVDFRSAWKDIVHPEDKDHVLSRWNESMRTGAAYEVEARFRRKDGTYRWFLCRAMPLRDGGRILKWFGTCTDIHEQRLAAEERERMLARAEEAVHARDVFLAVAAHELKTPLTPLRLETESLLASVRAGRVERLTPTRLQRRLSVVERQVGRLEQLVAALLDVTRIAGGKFELRAEDVDLGAVVQEVTERYKNEVQSSGSELVLRLAPSVIGQWDRLRIDQVVTNLLTNAVRYGEGKPITIEVGSDAERARLVVRDLGIGIALQDQDRIFRRFERAASEQHYGGLGLGLWIVQQVVTALGGTIRVESELGCGSTFTVELPLHRDLAA
jgi:hypothetical protein